MGRDTPIVDESFGSREMKSKDRPMKLVRAGLVPLALVTGGIIIGIVVASNMGWLPTGTAGPEPIPNPISSSGCDRATVADGRREWEKLR